MTDQRSIRPADVRAGNGTLLTLRVLIVAQAAAILAQAVFAGMFLNGDEALRDVHGTGAGAVHLFGLLQLIAAIVYWRPGRGPGWPVLVSLALLLLGIAQSATGGSGAVAVHVPLGMSLFGLTVWLVVWAVRAGRPAHAADRA